jgi:hypothetical protein
MFFFEGLLTTELSQTNFYGLDYQKNNSRSCKNLEELPPLF